MPPFSIPPKTGSRGNFPIPRGHCLRKKFFSPSCYLLACFPVARPHGPRVRFNLGSLLLARPPRWRLLFTSIVAKGRASHRAARNAAGLGDETAP